MIGVCWAVTLACFMPHVGVADSVVSKSQACAGTMGQSIILIHVRCQSQIRGGLWHYKRLWLKFILGLFPVHGSYQCQCHLKSNQMPFTDTLYLFMFVFKLVLLLFLS